MKTFYLTFSIYLLCVFCVCVCLYAMYLPGASWGQKSMSDPQEL